MVFQISKLNVFEIQKAFSNDYDYPDYDADYEDETWLNEKKKTLPKDFNQDLLLYFESIMDRLEKVTSHSNIVSSCWQQQQQQLIITHFI